MKKNLIVARYQENIDWIFDNRDEFNDVFVFNKGTPLEHNPGVIEISLPNIGREAHTYLYYLTKFYENIKPDECYIFTQADPYDVNSHFLRDVLQISEVTQFPIPLSKFSAKEPIVTIFWDAQATGFPHRFPVGAYLHRLFYFDMSEGHHLNIWQHHYFNGLWAAKGSDILFRSKKFYQNCMAMMAAVEHPIEAHMFERLWQYIFDSQYLDWDTHYDKIRAQFVGGGFYKSPIT